MREQTKTRIRRIWYGKGYKDAILEVLNEIENPVDKTLEVLRKKLYKKKKGCWIN